MKNLILVIIVSISFSFTSCNEKANTKNTDTVAVVQEASVAPSLVDLGIDEVDYNGLRVANDLERAKYFQTITPILKNELGGVFALGTYINNKNFIFFGTQKGKYYSISCNVKTNQVTINEIEKSKLFDTKRTVKNS